MLAGQLALTTAAVFTGAAVYINGGSASVAGRQLKKRSSSRMTDTDAAPFRDLQPDPWPKVRDLLEAA
jgi:hypothetical protein